MIIICSRYQAQEIFVGAEPGQPLATTQVGRDAVIRNSPARRQSASTAGAKLPVTRTRRASSAGSPTDSARAISSSTNAMLTSFARWGMRVTIGPSDELGKVPDIEVRDFHE